MGPAARYVHRSENRSSAFFVRQLWILEQRYADDVRNELASNGRVESRRSENGIRSSPYVGSITAEKLKQAARYESQMRRIFQHADTSGDGMVSWAEFDTILQNPRMRSFLAIMDFEVEDATHLFELLDTGDGNISYEE